MSKNEDVSVLVICYNQEKYIGKTIDSLLMQKTDFVYQIYISDDFSTDNTFNIVSEYAAKYPGKIKAYKQVKNLGHQLNLVSVLNKCKGKYIAICEGDDYWIDPLKLQKQYNILENRTDCSLCFHNAIVINENKRVAPLYFCDEYQKSINTVLDIVNGWFIPTPSMFFRNIEKLPEWFSYIHNGDYGLQLLLGNMGNAYFIDELMAVICKHSGGIGANSLTTPEFIDRQLIELFTKFDDYTLGQYHSIVKQRINSFEADLKKIAKRNKNLIYKFYRKVKSSF